MSHRTARLSVFSRQVLVYRVLYAGWPASEVARQFQVSRSTAYKWVRRFRDEGLSGLVDRSSRPHRSPRALERAEIEAILPHGRIADGVPTESARSRDIRARPSMQSSAAKV